jgi:hypothetical protein
MMLHLANLAQHRAVENVLVKVLVRKRKRAMLIALGTSADGSYKQGRSGTEAFVARLPALSFLLPGRKQQAIDRSMGQAVDPKASSVRAADASSALPETRGDKHKALIATHAAAGTLRSTGLLVEHSSMQRAFQIFLRVLTVLFLTVALHHVNADAATRAFFQQVDGPAEGHSRGESIDQMMVSVASTRRCHGAVASLCGPF